MIVNFIYIFQRDYIRKESIQKEQLALEKSFDAISQECQEADKNSSHQEALAQVDDAVESAKKELRNHELSIAGTETRKKRTDLLRLIHLPDIKSKVHFSCPQSLSCFCLFICCRLHSQKRGQDHDIDGPIISAYLRGGGWL